jgi:hypothetical protein
MSKDRKTKQSQRGRTAEGPRMLFRHAVLLPAPTPALAVLSCAALHESLPSPSHMLGKKMQEQKWQPRG